MPPSTTFSFLVVAPDYMDADASKRRNDAKDSHIEHMGKFGKAGILRAGGGMLPADNYDFSSGAKVTGSFMIFEAESIEAVKQIIEEDIFWTQSVWDHEKLQIIPFYSPLPIPPLMS
ncbi:hypothetical protein BDY19DRAFT_889336 [Irpex rosettiformis]|uniref:Uncharacterized protein n=1 Tax=Irpex rosettiformis TaxID=378272 RepID=A0ACB8U617_9APHY|nr:hypothetical protein BDY19DRAFT_889336 [Irpex rosettiformis]